MHSQILIDVKGESPVTEIASIRPVHSCDSMSHTNLHRLQDSPEGVKEAEAFLLKKKKSRLLQIMYRNNKYNCRTEKRKKKKKKKLWK